MVSSAFPRPAEYAGVKSTDTCVSLNNHCPNKQLDESMTSHLHNPIRCWMIIKSWTKLEESYLFETTFGKNF